MNKLQTISNPKISVVGLRLEVGRFILAFRFSSKVLGTEISDTVDLVFVILGFEFYLFLYLQKFIMPKFIKFPLQTSQINLPPNDLDCVYLRLKVRYEFFVLVLWMENIKTIGFEGLRLEILHITIDYYHKT